MAKLTITDKDIARLHPPSKGWHVLQLESNKEQLTKDRQSTIIVLTFNVIRSAVSDNDIGKKVERTYSTKAPGFAIPMVSACLSIPIDEVKTGTIDFDALVGKQAWNELVEEPYQGRILIKSSDNWASVDSDPPF